MIVVNRVTGALALALTWVLLVGELSVANAVAGLVIGSAAVAILTGGRAARRHRFAPVGGIVLAARLAVDLAVASWRVATAVLAPTPDRLRTGVVRVPLESDSELVATIVADLISLTPGTLTLEVTTGPTQVVVHVLGLRDREAVAASVRRLERRALRAVRPVPGPEVGTS